MILEAGAHAAGDGQRADERALLPPLVARAGLRARAAAALRADAGAERCRRRPLSAARRARRAGRRQHEIRRAGAAGRPATNSPNSPGSSPAAGCGSPPRRIAARSAPPREAHQQLVARFPDLLTLIAPRHPERGAGDRRGTQRDGAVLPAALARGSARTAIARSTSATRSANSGCSTGWPASSSSASRCRRGGGQNPIEPAKLASAILHGPHVGNFADVYAPLDAAGGRAGDRRRGGARRRARRPVRRRRPAAGDGAARRAGGRGARRRRRARAGGAVAATGRRWRREGAARLAPAAAGPRSPAR